MDSKLIFIKAEHLISKVEWEPSPDHGWLYCGRSKDFNQKLVNEFIVKINSTGKIYFVCNRHNSKLIEKTEATRLASAVIDESSFSIWSEDFCNVIEFDKIGVFRFGCVCG